MLFAQYGLKACYSIIVIIYSVQMRVNIACKLGNDMIDKGDIV